MNKNVPNYITVLRILLVPVIFYLFMFDSFYIRLLVLVLIIISELTDFLDGYIARKYNCVSDAGKILDPFADSISRITVFLNFVLLKLINPWFFLLCIFRDSLTQTIRIIAANNNIVFDAKLSGKIKAIFQCIGIILITILSIINLKYNIENLYIYTNIIMLIVTIVTLWSGIDYLIKLLKMLKK
jgi:CDP-diacylglycerol--glycerol-3-phosphate 3-phosphatidyltransferase